MLFGDIDLHLLGEGNHRRLWDLLGAHVTAGGARFAVWAPNARRVSVTGDWNDWTPGEDDLVPQGRSGYWAGEVAGVVAGQRYKFAVEGADGATRLKADPVARQAELPPDNASIVVAPSAYPWADEAWITERDAHSSSQRPLRVYEVHLGSWQPGLGYRRRGRTAGGPRRAPGVHARRTAPRRRAPLRRLVGLPGERVLRADGALRNAGRAPSLRRRAAPAGHRRDRRLGAGPLPQGRLEPCPLRRHGAVRARGSPPRGAPRLGDARVQLRPQRGPQLPRGQRALLVRGVPHRRAPRRRRGIDALPRLLAPGRRLDPEPARWPGEPRRDRVPPSAERGRVRSVPRRADDRGGVDGLAAGDPSGPPRRTRVLAQVEHGVDARHPRVHVDRPGAPPLAPPRSHLRSAVRVQRAVRAAPQPRRGRSRQGLVAGQDVGRRVAALRQPAGHVRLDVGLPRGTAAVHGR